MNRILQAKDAFKSFYEKYDRLLDGAVRFLFALMVYLTVFYNTGYSVRLTRPYIAVLLAFISSFLPISAVSIIMSILLLAEFASVSLEVMAVGGLLLALMLLLYFVFRPGKSILVAFACLLCLWKMPQAILPAALLLQPTEILMAAFGILMYGLIAVVKKDLPLLSASSSLGMTGKINQLLTDLFSNERIMLVLLSVTAAMLLICIIKRQRINYAHLTGIIAGDFLYLVIVIVGDLVLKVAISLPSLILGFAVNALIALFIIYLLINMDYRHTEEVEFEDDDYYYYVKAVPKMTVSALNKTVETISEPEKPEETTFSVEDIFVRTEESSEEEDKHAE